MNTSSHPVWRLISTLADWSNAVAAFALALMMFHVTIDVVCRYFFSAPLTGTIEIVSTYYMVAVIAFPMAYLHDRDQHIRVELFTSGLSKKTLAKFDFFVEFIILACVFIMAVYGFEEAWDRSVAGEVWEAGQALIDVWPSRWFLPIGFLLMAIVSLAKIIVFIRNPPSKKVMRKNG